MKVVDQIGDRVAETIERWRPSWPDVIRWAGYAGFVAFVVLPALIFVKIALKIVMLLVAW
jgi:hypothetical protein